MENDRGYNHIWLAMYCCCWRVSVDFPNGVIRFRESYCQIVRSSTQWWSSAAPKSYKTSCYVGRCRHFNRVPSAVQALEFYLPIHRGQSRTGNWPHLVDVNGEFPPSFRNRSSPSLQ